MENALGTIRTRTVTSLAGSRGLQNTFAVDERTRGRHMRAERQGFDYGRYRRLLVEAVDEQKRMALIDLLIEERAMDRLAEHTASQRGRAPGSRS